MLRGLRSVKDVVGEGSGLAICFANGSVLHVRDGHILQNGQWIKMDARERNLRLFAKATVKQIFRGEKSLNIRLKGYKILSITSGFLVSKKGRTFDIEDGKKLAEREIYLRDGI